MAWEYLLPEAAGLLGQADRRSPMRTAEWALLNFGGLAVRRTPESAHLLFEMRKFESCSPGRRVFVHSDSKMQRFESARPSQPVRSPPANMRRPLKRPPHRGIS
jgi:hypothetical protein